MWGAGDKPLEEIRCEINQADIDIAELAETPHAVGDPAFLNTQLYRIGPCPLAHLVGLGEERRLMVFVLPLDAPPRLCPPLRAFPHTKRRITGAEMGYRRYGVSGSTNGHTSRP